MMAGREAGSASRPFLAHEGGKHAELIRSTVVVYLAARGRLAQG